MAEGSAASWFLLLSIFFRLSARYSLARDASEWREEAGDSFPERMQARRGNFATLDGTTTPASRHTAPRASSSAAGSPLSFASFSHFGGTSCLPQFRVSGLSLSGSQRRGSVQIKNSYDRLSARLAEVKVWRSLYRRGAARLVGPTDRKMCELFFVTGHAVFLFS